VRSSFIGNFTIKRSGDACAGIDIEAEDAVIKENIITDNEYAIYISNVNYTVILENIISNNNLGLWLSYSYHNNISNNQFFNDGIFIFNSCYNIISNNMVNGKPLIYVEEEANKNNGRGGTNHSHKMQ